MSAHDPLIDAYIGTDALGVTVRTETEVQVTAAEAIVKMEIELAQLQQAGGLSAINRSIQRDSAAARVRTWDASILYWSNRLTRYTAYGGVARRCDGLVARCS